MFSIFSRKQQGLPIADEMSRGELWIHSHDRAAPLARLENLGSMTCEV